MAGPIPTNRGDIVRLKGFHETKRDLRKLQDKSLWDREFKEGLGGVASFVIDKAKVRLSAYGAMYGRAAESMRPSKSAQGARILAGGARYPFFGGAEFGAYSDRTRRSGDRLVKGWNQFGGAPVKGGRSIYPTVRDENPEIMRRVDDMVQRVAARAFPERT